MQQALSPFALPDHWPETPIPLASWQHFRIVPIAWQQQRLCVAVATTHAEQHIETLSFRLKCEITTVWWTEAQLEQAMQAFVRDAHSQDDAINMASSHDGTIDTLQSLLNAALLERSSDVHIEPYAQGYRQRCRIDGLLHEVDTWSHSQGERLIGRLKLLAGLDIGQARRPQDGALRMPLLSANDTDIRLSTLPTLYGEKAVLRFVPAGDGLRSCDQLGLTSQQSSALEQALHQRAGLVLVTGPTGSGKSASLYSMLKHLQQGAHINIASVEDPIEARLSGINQVQIDRVAGLDFATVLRAFLRQDPDVMMIGEMRDTETARIAIQAAQTGHLVLSSLHTGSVASALVRLHDLGIAPYNIAAGLRLIVAQRLVRRLCWHCREVDTNIPAELPQGTYYRAGAGCEQCRLGYQGRMGIFEVVTMTAALRHAIVTQQQHDEIAQHLRKTGVDSLFDAGITRARQGETSLEEVYRVLQ